jgi:hypothetical protein
MESNLGSIQPQQVHGVRATPPQRDRKRKKPPTKPFELEENADDLPARCDHPNSPDHGAVSERQAEEAGGRIDLTA